MQAPITRKRSRGLGPALMRMSATNRAAQMAKASVSLSTSSTCSNASQLPAQPAARFSRVEIASDTSSKKPNAST